MTPVREAQRPKDPDLDRPPPAKLLAIDWSTVQLNSEADALALWQRIAPTGLDWSEKLDEVPGDGPIVEQLALALLHGGNFQCAAQTNSCGKPPIELPELDPAATLADPCLRRQLALWSINQLDEDLIINELAALRVIVALPPPESELIATAIKALPDSEHKARLELLAIAFRAGHRELVNGLVAPLDEPFLLEAVQKHHIDGALDLITAESHRAVFSAALTDEQLHPNARVAAMIELVATDPAKLAKDTRTAIIKATRSKSCAVAAAAARFLVRNGDKKFGPGKPRTGKPDVMMRALCVLASYEQGLRPDEPSFLLAYVPKKGLELVTTTYDEYRDPKTETTTIVVPRDEVTLPEVEDLVRAMATCKGTTCASDDREFRFGFKGADLLLHRIEVTERPPCKRP